MDLHQFRLPAAFLMIVALLPTAAECQGNPPSDSTRLQLVREVLEVTQVAQQSLSVMENMAQQQRSINPQIPPAFWDLFIKRAHEQIGELVDRLVPVYAE